jgi:transcriptional regulator with XRE-family HTH domain
MSVKADTTLMSKSFSIPLPASHALRKLGRDLALARRKRGISTSDMAERLFVSRDTLWRLERGDSTVALGTLATAAFVLQLHDRLANLAEPPPMRSRLIWTRGACPNASAAHEHERGSPLSMGGQDSLCRTAPQVAGFDPEKRTSGVCPLELSISSVSSQYRQPQGGG